MPGPDPAAMSTQEAYKLFNGINIITCMMIVRLYPEVYQAREAYRSCKSLRSLSNLLALYQTAYFDYRLSRAVSQSSGLTLTARIFPCMTVMIILLPVQMCLLDKLFSSSRQLVCKRSHCSTASLEVLVSDDYGIEWPPHQDS